jgi:hypothetical protein
MRFIAYIRKPFLYSFAIALGLVCASTVFAQWSAPLNGPPTCISGNPGCDAPLNVSSTGQTKAGNLTALGLSATSLILSPEFCIGSSCITSWPSGGGASQWTTSGSNIYYNSGNVGIGTTNPGGKLDVEGGSIVNNGATLYGFGGSFDKNISTGGCTYSNAVTGACSCPGGYSTELFAEFYNTADAVTHGLYFCYLP